MEAMVLGEDSRQGRSREVEGGVVCILALVSMVNELRCVPENQLISLSRPRFSHL